MKKQRLTEYTASMQELNTQEKKKIDGGFTLRWSPKLKKWVRVKDKVN